MVSKVCELLRGDCHSFTWAPDPSVTGRAMVSVRKSDGSELRIVCVSDPHNPVWDQAIIEITELP